VTVSAAVFAKRKQDLMQTRSSKCAIEKQTKTMAEAQEKNHTDPIDLSSRMPLGQLMRRQSSTHTKREQTELTPLSPPEKNSCYFWVPPPSCYFCPVWHDSGSPLVCTLFHHSLYIHISYWVALF
jgi:hypothetical protein